MAELPRYVRYYGQDISPTQVVPLRAGVLSLVYEAGDLRYICLGEHEILRRVYAAVRDHNWRTIPVQIRPQRMDIRADSFHIVYEAVHQEADIHFIWTGTIVGTSDGILRFEMDGEALTTFKRNRVGFCVLHPMDCAGKRCRIEHMDGTITEGTFPNLIEPHQPFLNMRSIAHEVQQNIWATTHFDGDIFEMEDQRNWTDASYKTYCTPLALPFPATIEKGTRVKQSVSLELKSNSANQPIEMFISRPPDIVEFTISDQVVAQLPRIGLCVAGHGEALSSTEIQRLQILNLTHLRVDLTPSEADMRKKLEQAKQEAVALGTQLEIALHLGPNAENDLSALEPILSAVRPSVYVWLIFQYGTFVVSAEVMALVKTHLMKFASDAHFANGTDAWFVQLNRNRPEPSSFDLLTYTLNPQVHAFDNASLVESLSGQGTTLMTAKSFSGGKPIMVSPVTFKMRSNPAATSQSVSISNDQLPQQVDPRQMSLFGAGWTLGSIKYLAEAGAHSITFYETIGWLGVMERQSGSPLPQLFPSVPEAVFPLFHVLADVGEFNSGEVLGGSSNNPLIVEGLVLRKNHNPEVLLTNFSAQSQKIRVLGLPSHVTCRHLNEVNVFQAMQNPEGYRANQLNAEYVPAKGLELNLMPFATVCIKSVNE
ncbi:MAG: hypothetical protein H0X30_03135 [Anaerolineae bacterium]|nr:hypothetical protein [Anaerolineae bacterium]